MENIKFSVGEHWIELNEMTTPVDILNKLSQMVFSTLINTKESKIKVRAEMFKDGKEHKLDVFIEKHPANVDDGKITMRDYIHEKVNILIIAMIRRGELV